MSALKIFLLLSFGLLFFTPVTKADAIEYVLVTRVLDGDTLKLSNGKTVRLIGVDTPETVHKFKPVQFFGLEASAFTKKMAEGKYVRLEYDWQRRDKYGRLLAYVYLLDRTFLNAEIIKQGYGFAYTRFPFQRMEYFRKLEREAREAKRGFWATRKNKPYRKASKTEGIGPEVKKSRSKICHARDSEFYANTQHYESFSTVNECLQSGGKLPQKISPHLRPTLPPFFPSRLEKATR